MTVTSTTQSPRVLKGRDALIRAASSVIAEQGLAELRVSDVTERAGVALGSFYRHFAAKEDIVDAVVAATTEALVDSLNEIAEGLDDAAEATSVAARALVGLGTNEADFARLLVRLDQATLRLDELITARAEPVFQRGIASGRFRLENARLAAKLAVAATLAALQSVVEGASSQDAEQHTAVWLLQALGIDHDEATEIASRPLPPLPALAWSARPHTAGSSPVAVAGADAGPGVEWTVERRSDVLAEYTRSGVLRLELNRPGSRNALDRQLGRELRDALARAAADESVRCVLISGAGEGFCSGWDVKSPGAPFGDESVVADIVNPIIEVIRSMPKPVVAKVQGTAAGVGCSIAMAADQVVAARSSSFLLAFARIGLSGDGGATALLPARVGVGRATRMLMLAEPVSAPDALGCGLVDHVVDDRLLESRATDLALRLASGPTRSYAATKKLLTAAATPDLAGQLGRELEVADELVTTDDYREGKQAFAEKRPTRFAGR